MLCQQSARFGMKHAVKNCAALNMEHTWRLRMATKRKVAGGESKGGEQAVSPVVAARLEQ